MKTYVLYHGNCYDGFGAAYAAWRSLRHLAGIEFIPCLYGKPMPAIEPGSRVYLLDFSYPREQLLRLAEFAELTVIDHHATAQTDLEGLPFAIFDLEKSGAVLAWEYFHGTEPPMMLRYLQDRDLWRFDLRYSRKISAAMRLYPMDFTVWEDLSDRFAALPDFAALVAEGGAALALTNAMVKLMADNAVTRYILGHEVPAANATVFFSEVGEELLSRHAASPFAAYYLDRADGRRQWGLRSRKGFDCSVIAKALGGGGHPQASGFQTSLNEFPKEWAEPVGAIRGED